MRIHVCNVPIDFLSYTHAPTAPQVMSAIAMVQYNNAYNAEWLMHYQVPQLQVD
jgi:hypothetical protein